MNVGKLPEEVLIRSSWFNVKGKVLELCSLGEWSTSVLSAHFIT